jgi:hypothetical protein
METLIGLLTLLALVGLSILAQFAPDDSVERSKAPGEARIKNAKSAGPSSLPVTSATTSSGDDSKLRHVVLGAIIGGSVSAIVSNLLMGRLPLDRLSDYMGALLVFFTR